jgi:branched-chain amino acid transport system permease protein
MQVFFQQVVNGLGQGVLIGLFAIGFGLVFSKLGILNVAHGTFATWGALIAFYAATGLGVPLWLAVAVGVVGAGLVGVLVDVLCFQPLRGRGSQMMIGTLITSIGVWIVSLSLAQELVGVHGNGYPATLLPEWSVSVFGVLILASTFINVCVAVVVVVAIWVLLNRTGFGAAVRAIGHDACSVAVVGVNPRLTIIGTAFLAAGVAGLAGGLAGITSNDISFNVGETLLLAGFAAVVLGGVGSIGGAMLGGITIGVVQVLSAQYVSSAFRDAITFGVLLAVLIIRPQGLFNQLEANRA